MKNIAIALLTSFYMLITTGLFVCAVHCSAEALAAKPSIKIQGSSCCSKIDQRKDGKNSGCCKKHGSFVVKENFKPGNEVHFTQIVFLTSSSFRMLAATRSCTAYSPSLIANNSPPGSAGKHLVIKFHSLLI